MSQVHENTRPVATRNLRRLVLRQFAPLILTIGLVWVLRDRLDGIDPGQIGTGLRTVTPSQWLIAAGLTGLSFWAVGRYDAVAHKVLGTRIPARAARHSGVAAIAIAQTVGFGVVSGALVRWYMLPGLSLLQAIRLSLLVATTFLGGWAILTAGILLLMPSVLPGSGGPALGVIAAGLVLAILSLLRPGPFNRLNLPSLRAMGAILLLVIVDTVAAGAAFYALLPAGVPISLPAAVSVYLLALGAGLISGTPGGVGPFEITLIALLPQLGDSDILVAVLAFRLVYYALPAIIAALLVLLGGRSGRGSERQDPGDTAELPASPVAIEHAIAGSPHAETALLRQGRFSLQRASGAHCPTMVAASGQSLLSLSDPLSQRPDLAAHVEHLGQSARQRYLVPCFYKAGARLAAAARRKGWRVLPIAREAWLDPRDFTNQGATRRQLRRKLRKAAAAGVIVTRAETPLPLNQMRDIAASWTRAHGGERGFSMGRFVASTLPYARIFLAYHNGRLVAFLTLHANPQEQVLDLMRQHPDIPDGSMHLLLREAIESAARENCPRLSLAAVPVEAHAGGPRLFIRLRDRLDLVSGARGLRQFKTAFAPSWRTLYMAAPTRTGLFLAGCDLLREITRPAPVRDS